MNNPHQNARMTPLGRAEMVRRIVEEGRPVAEVATGFGVSERTARKWLARYRAEGVAGLKNRSSRPQLVANRTLEPWIDMMEALRREYRLTAEEIAAQLRLARSTVAAWLKRRGLGRLRLLEAPAPVRRYQRQRPGELLHLDIKKLARFERVGHRITGDRRGKGEGAGYDFFHVAIRRRHQARLRGGAARRAARLHHKLPCPCVALVQSARHLSRAGDDRQRLRLCRPAVPQSAQN